MNEKTETLWVDRAGWNHGPWDNEVDRYEWRYQGMPCLIVRNQSGALCGYVGVPPSHPWHGKTDDDVYADVHGGITYADKCQAGGHICHVAQPGEPDDVWWLGFDCAHHGDFVPAYDRERAWGFSAYRNQSFVRAEVESLARQAIEAGK